MIVKVYHMPNDIFSVPAFMTGYELQQFVKLNRDKYIHVADVDTDKYEEAYYLTNSIYDHWSRNRQVQARIPDCRSTSVGDVLAKDNKEVIVSRFGFDTVT